MAPIIAPCDIEFRCGEGTGVWVSPEHGGRDSCALRGDLKVRYAKIALSSPTNNKNVFDTFRVSRFGIVSILVTYLAASRRTCLE